MITSIVKVSGADMPVVPVRTKKAIPKDKIDECVNALRKVTVSAPVSIGDIIMADVAGTGVDIIATSSTTGDKK